MDDDGRDAPVVVCGGGAAGIAASLSSARCGARVLLVESAARLGGTVADALIHTLAGLYDGRGELLHAGLTQELTDRLLRQDTAAERRRMGRVWVLAVCPDVYRRVLETWIAATPRITVMTSTRVTNLTRRDHRIAELEIFNETGRASLFPRAVVDATGTAEIVRLMDPNLVYDEADRAAGARIVRLRGVAPGTLDFPRGVGVVRALREAAAEGRLPPDCANTWIDRGLDADEAFIKLLVLDTRSAPRPFVVPASAGSTSQRPPEGGTTSDGLAAVIAFLRELPGFARAEVVRIGGLGLRDGGRVRGEYCLTGDDVRQCRKFHDAACRACWPIEYWDQVDGVSLEYLPDGEYYEIPRRSLSVAGIRSLWAAGKCLSADKDAQASARVVGTCWAMGEAVGRVAAVEDEPVGNALRGVPCSGEGRP